ncbi:MAG: LysR family transcriptional regulator [Vicinamibacterales bacterium]
MIPPDLIASFEAVAADLSYTRAASRLHLAQPALTKRIQLLERMLGLALFTRTRRSVRLTPAGEALRPAAAAVLDSMRAFEAAASRINDRTAGRLRVGFSPSAPHHVLPRLMRAFRRRHGGVECVLTELASDAQVDQLLSGDLDVGILRPPVPVPTGLHCRTFFVEPFVIVLPKDHPLAALRRVPISRIAGEPFVLISRKVAAVVYDRILAACAESNVVPHSVREASHVHAVVSLVAAGCGVSILPRSAAQVGVSDVVARPLGGNAGETQVAVAYAKRGTAPAALAFGEIALQVGASLTPSRS